MSSVRFFNYWEQTALEKLGAKGLTQSMLVNRNSGGYKFDDDHYFALKHLVTERGICISDALSVLEGLSSAQAGGIREDLLREDVIHLSNFWHIAALRILKRHGLTAEMLIMRNDGDYEFNENHCFALRNLINNRKFSVAAALSEIDGLNGSQAGGIQEGLCREDVIHLSNYWHISALERLRPYGLTAEMLLGRNEGGHRFDVDHCYLLVDLVKDHGLSVAMALAEIDGMSSDEAFRLRNEGRMAGSQSVDAEEASNRPRMSM